MDSVEHHTEDNVDQLIQPAPPPDVLTIADLTSVQSIIMAKRQADKAILESIGGQNILNLKPKLIEWVLKGYPNAYPIITLSIQPPTICCDGCCRELGEYIEYCSGKAIHEHIAELQAKLPDITVSFANIGGNVTIVVSRP